MPTTGEDERRSGIWLEVTEARFEGGSIKKCEVLFKADRSYPKPVWWPVSDDALSTDKKGLKAYEAIVYELDKKRVVLAQLGCQALPANKNTGGTHYLECVALRFQSPELGSR